MITNIYSPIYEGETAMTIQDELRAEEIEVSDTGGLLRLAADMIDALEEQVAAGNPARIATLEQALTDIQAIIVAVL
jgi:hypothetical protein